MLKPNNCIETKAVEWVDNYFTKECPKLYLDEYSLLINLYIEKEKNGTWPNVGGILQQSAIAYELFGIIASEVNKIKSEE